MLVQFRTRGGPSQGWGNIYRLAAFARACIERRGASVRFLAEGQKATIEFLESRGFEATLLPDNISLEDEEQIIADLPPADITIIEMLDSRYDRQALLKRYTSRLVVFDDLLDHRYCADLVIGSQALPGYGNREISDPSTRFLTGFQYFPFDSSFNAPDPRQREFADDVKRVLIAFGGGHYDAAYLKAAIATSRLNIDVATTIILGPDAPPRLAGELAALIPDADILAGVDNMADRMRATDLALVSAGYLKLEAAVTGTPAITISTQWHQIPLGQTFEELTGVPTAGYMGFLTSDTLLEMIHALLPLDARRRQARQCIDTIDTKGTDRVLDAVFGEIDFNSAAAKSGTNGESKPL